MNLSAPSVFSGCLYDFQSEWGRVMIRHVNLFMYMSVYT